jgi:phage gp46-like protein
MPSIPPAGYSPASAYSLIGHAEQQSPVPILADMIDAKTGDYLSIEDSGAAVLGFGHRFRELRQLSSDAPVLAESLAREALQPAIDAGVVQFEKLAASANTEDGTQLDTDIEYLDLLAPREDALQRLTFTP